MEHHSSSSPSAAAQSSSMTAAPDAALAPLTPSTGGSSSGPVSSVLPDLNAPPMSLADEFSGFSNEELEREIKSLAAHLDAGTCRWLLLIAEYDRRAAYEEWGLSLPRWLSWQCGISPGAARERVRIARALIEMPIVREGFATGKLSYSKVRALTRVVQPETEAELVKIAYASTASILDQIGNAIRRDGETRERKNANAANAHRSFQGFWTDRGTYRFFGELPAEAGRQLETMLEAGRDTLYKTAPNQADENQADETEPDENAPAGTPPTTNRDATTTERDENAPAGTPEPTWKRLPLPPLPTRNADALLLAAESFLATGARHHEGADAYQVITIIDANTLAHPDDNTDTAPAAPPAPIPSLAEVFPGPTSTLPATCHLENGPTISAHVARRLACDCTAIAALLDDADRPLHIGRHTRLINRRLRRALKLRDGHCQFPGCDNKGHLDAHHVRHWVNGGLTNIENLVLLCKHHHGAVHEGGYTLQRHHDATIVVHRPDGTPLVVDPTQIDPTHTIEEQLRADGLTIDDRTHRCEWEGRGAGISDILTYIDRKTRQAEQQQERERLQGERDDREHDRHQQHQPSTPSSFAA